MTREEPLRGQCLCGEVRYEASGPVGEMWYCHCRECRKASGAGFGTWIAAHGVRWLAGEERVVRVASSGGLTRAFCAQCGTVLPALRAAGGALLPAGGLDRVGAQRPSCHAFVAGRAPWLPVCDGDLPAFAGSRDEGNGAPGRLGTGAPAARAADEPVPGSCLCGAVAFTVSPPLFALRVCHCSRCRRRGGSSWFAGLAGSRGSLSFLRGEDRTRRWHMPGTRYFTACFCGECGTGVPSVLDHGTFIAAGTLDDDPRTRIRCHVFYGSRAPWVAIEDGLPRFEAFTPPDFDWRTAPGAA